MPLNWNKTKLKQRRGGAVATAASPTREHMDKPKRTREFLEAVCGCVGVAGGEAAGLAELTEDVLEYVLTVAAEIDASDAQHAAELGDLLQLVEGLVPATEGCVESGAAMELAESYVRDLTGAARRKEQQAAAAAGGRKQKQQARQQARRKKQDLREAPQDPPPPAPPAAAGAAAAEAEAAPREAVAGYKEQIALLQELCGGESTEGAAADVLEYVLVVRCSGDMERASHWVLQNLLSGGGAGGAGESVDDVVHAAQAWQAEAARRKKAAGSKLSDKDAKRALVTRYDMTAADTLANGAVRKPVVNWEDKRKNKGKTEIRYREGHAVKVKKGERFSLVDDGKAEWDGGSRGKVTTKGKRGKGFA